SRAGPPKHGRGAVVRGAGADGDAVPTPRFGAAAPGADRWIRFVASTECARGAPAVSGAARGRVTLGGFRGHRRGGPFVGSHRGVHVDAPALGPTAAAPAAERRRAPARRLAAPGAARDTALMGAGAQPH